MRRRYLILQLIFFLQTQAQQLELKVFFEKNQYTLSEVATKTLDSFYKEKSVEVVERNSQRYSYQIVGYSDTIGLLDYNKQLAWRRAEEVKNYLNTKFPAGPLYSNQLYNFPHYQRFNCAINQIDSIVKKSWNIPLSTMAHGEVAGNNLDQCRNVSLYKLYTIVPCGGVIFGCQLPHEFDTISVGGFGRMCFPPGSIQNFVTRGKPACDSTYTPSISFKLLDSIVVGNSIGLQYEFKLTLDRIPEVYNMPFCKDSIWGECIYSLPAAYLELTGNDSIEVFITQSPRNCSTRFIKDLRQKFYNSDCRIPAQWLYERSVKVLFYRHLPEAERKTESKIYLLSSRGKKKPVYSIPGGRSLFHSAVHVVFSSNEKYIELIR